MKFVILLYFFLSVYLALSFSLYLSLSLSIAKIYIASLMSNAEIYTGTMTDNVVEIDNIFTYLPTYLPTSLPAIGAQENWKILIFLIKINVGIACVALKRKF